MIIVERISHTKTVNDIFALDCIKNSIIRSSHRRCSVKIDVLRNFTKFTGTHLCQSLFFNKVVDLRLATLLKKRLWHRCFCEISEKIFFTEHVWTTASTAGQLDVKLRSRCEVLLPSELRNYITH